jgi:hypothetical protein
LSNCGVRDSHQSGCRLIIAIVVVVVVIVTFAI